jgi:hypothetical protein
VKHSRELIIHCIGQSCECHSPISFHKSHVNILEVCKGNSSCNDSVVDNRVSYIQELDHQPFNPASYREELHKWHCTQVWLHHGQFLLTDIWWPIKTDLQRLTLKIT